MYVHVPFCVSICPYCDFVVVAGAAVRGPRSSVGRFLAALEAELGLRADALDAAWGPPRVRPVLETLYLGGGTPSLLPVDAIARLADVVRGRYGLADEPEVTIEANPGPDERGDPRALRAAGVTRLSIGAQSLDDGELRRLGRRHRAEDVAATVSEARAAGIRSVSLDLLYDIPGQTLPTWRATLDAAVALEPDHLSLYALTLDDPVAEGLTGPAGDHLPTSAGARRWRLAARGAQDDDRAAEMYELADRRLAAAGYAWYEISNWARPGHRSRHNLAYWRRRPVEAVGPGAHAFDGRSRRWNAARLGPYLDAFAPPDAVAPGVGSGPGDRSAPHLPPGGDEAIDGELAAAEAAILALRTADGSAAMDPGQLDWLRDRLAMPIAAGLVAEDGDGRLVLTTRGRLLSNEVFRHLLPASTDDRVR
ncbi:MAG TPA: radical SAM family heme chaperone HemW [Candidatus Limnocylindrales bacterium]|nr:radical SAM family heme chaperone HemW [Candidatus Limnocylindrales bacterium]